MKKLLAVILCVSCFLAAFASCNSQAPADSPNNTVNETETDKSVAQYNCGKIAYDELVYASDICTKMGDALYNAWYFAIYEADDYGSANAVNQFSYKTGISVSDLNKAAEVYLDNLAPYLHIYLGEFQYAVAIAMLALELNGTVEKLDTALQNAKSELKTMTQKYSDYSEYPNLKSLYSEVDSYATFLKAPDGSFQQLKTTIENYETRIRTYKSDLSFIFED